MANTIVWFDLPVKNLENATEFYAKLLDKPLQINTEYGFRMTVFPHEGNDVAGCLYEDSDPKAYTPAGVLIYFDVNDRINAAVAFAREAGSEIIEEVQPLGQWGFRAIITDCDGNRIALHAASDK